MFNNGKHVTVPTICRELECGHTRINDIYKDPSSNCSQIVSILSDCSDALYYMTVEMSPHTPIDCLRDFVRSNRGIIRGIIDHDCDDISGVIADGFLRHNQLVPNRIGNRQAIRGMVLMEAFGFRDIASSLERIIDWRHDW